MLEMLDEQPFRNGAAVLRYLVWLMHPAIPDVPRRLHR